MNGPEPILADPGKADRKGELSPKGDAHTPLHNPDKSPSIR